MLLPSTEKTWDAAVQQTFLQGRLRRCSSALSETRWPSTPPGNLSSLQRPQQYQHGRVSVNSQEMSQCETLHSNDWIINIASVTAVAFGFVNTRLRMREKSRFTSNTLHPSVNLHQCTFLSPWAEWEDRYDLLHSRLLPLHHKGARGAGQGTVEQHGEQWVTRLVFNGTWGQQSPPSLFRWIYCVKKWRKRMKRII